MAKKMPQKECPNCQKLVGHYRIKAHIRACEAGRLANIGRYSDLKQEDGSYLCNICNKKFDPNAISFHYRTAHTDFLKKLQEEGRTGSGWNKGLNKSDPRIQKYIETNRDNDNYNKNYTYLKDYINKNPEKHAEQAADRKLKHKKGNYRVDSSDKKVWLQTSWETDLADYLNRNGIKWIRPKSGFIYYDNSGKLRRYYPDFYLLDLDLYLDPKNDYVIRNDTFKINSVRISNPDKKFIILSGNSLYHNPNKRIIRETIEFKSVI